MTDSQLQVNDWQNHLLIPEADQEKFEAQIAQEVDFLPSIKLLQNTNQECGPAPSDPKAGEFFLTLKNRKLGHKVLICVLGVRPHALLIQGGKKTKESFKFNSPIFKEIQNTPADGVVTQVMWSGGEFLCWLPAENEWGVLFPGKPKTRPAAGEILTYMRPPQDRKVEASKDLPHTNCFSLVSKLQSWGPVKKSYIIQIVPEEPARSNFPEQESADTARRMFIEPIGKEPNVEVITPANAGVDR